ncbi:MAG: hypothetical protein HOV79_21090 [Hamadaea sp.]|nr:hypothetical protein [Hamadaea sp.]
MPTIRVDTDTVTVELSPMEKVGAIHGDLTVPRSSIASARAVAEPMKDTTGMRAPGYAMPGHAKLGTWRHHDGKDFIAVYADRPAVELVLTGERYERLLVAADDPDAIVADLGM